ncbi:MAG: DUF4304 domain-containing protein [Planctomycetes bacterium]|nr:DUF4304 domain-containing protein [Planctomycetota bacterium]
MKALALRLYPILRADGFRGSGNTLRRVDEQVVHVFNLQASTGGSECYLNLGAHLMFLPTPGGSVPDAKSIKEYECAFRDRFDPPSGSSHGWSYGRNEDELNETIAFICDHWSNYGRAFFDRYSHFPDSFHLLVDDIDPSGVHPTELLTFARIAAHLHKNARSESLAQEALRRCPERATDLRAELSQLIHDVNSTRTKR